jgi:perosamine synthetase
VKAQELAKNRMKTMTSIPWANPDLVGNEAAYVNQALASNWISGGKFVERFENDFASYCGAAHAITASNGTTALHLALLVLSLEPGDEVVVPGFAFMAAANVTLHIKARPIFVDVDPKTWCMTADAVERSLSPRTKAIVPVHTYGNVCATDEIIALATDKAIPVIEDAAEAFGSRHKDHVAGTEGTMGIFSFHAAKTITTGEGGMVITSSQELSDRLRLYKNQGMSRLRYWHEVPGHNFRMTNMQAALGCAQLEKMDEIVRDRRRVYETYQTQLARVDGVTMQHFRRDVDPVVWSVAVELDSRAYPQGRDEVMRQLQSAGIETRNGFYAASMHKHLYDCSAIPICERLAQQVLSLPTYRKLQDCEIDFICSELKELRR